MCTKTTPLAILLVCLTACIFGCGQPNNPQATEKQEFAIEGMSCEGCVNTITTALKAIPGVTSAKVSLQDKKATVVADSVSSQTIEDTVAKAGYKARLITAAGAGR
jgi:copper chaperone